MTRRSLYFALSFLALLVLGVLLGFLWKRAGSVVAPSLTKLPKVEVIPQVPQSTASAYRLSALFPEVKNLPVYEYSFPGGAPKERAVKWARTLGFAGEPEEREGFLGTTFFFAKDSQTLTIDAKASELLYSVDVSAGPTALSGSFLPSGEQAKVIVGRTLMDLAEPSELLQFDKSATRFYKQGVSRPTPAAAESADFVGVRFKAAVGDYPLYMDSGLSLSHPVVASLGKDGKLLYLEYHVVGSIGEKIGDYPLKSRDEILADLKAGRGTIVESSFLGKPDISAVVINSVSIGYLLPLPDVNVLQPIYVLRGTAQEKSGGERVSLTIYLPAVRQPFLE